MTTFDFNDGNGPVPAHQHKNGGGWVADSATVERTAMVSGDARVYGHALVSGTALVSGDARVYGHARVSGTAMVYGTALVYGDARVSGDALVSGNARVSGDALVSGNALVSGDALVYGTARVYGDARLVKGYAFATKSKSWDITEVDNGDGTVTLYADAEFEPVSQVCECCGQRLASTDKGETP